MGANRAGCASGERFPRRSLGDWKVVATYTEEGKGRGLNTALRLLTDGLNAVLEATTVRRP